MDLEKNVQKLKRLLVEAKGKFRYQLFFCLITYMFIIFILLSERRNESRGTIERYCDFIETDICIRIESLKCYLEKLEIDLTDLLDKSNKLTLLDSDDAKQSKRMIQLLFSRPRAQQVKIDEIGRLSFNFDKAQFLSLRPKLIDLKTHMNYPMGICNLYKQNTRVDPKNELLLVADYSNSNILLYDKDFKLRKRVTQIDGLADWFKYPIRIESNGVDLLFILENSGHNVYAINFKEWRFSRVLAHGDGVQSIQAKDICFHGNKLYVLEFNDLRIRVYTAKGEFHKRLELDGCDFTRCSGFKVDDKFIAVGDSYSRIKLYNLANFCLQYFVNEPFDCFCLQDSNLVVLTNKSELKFYELPRVDQGDPDMFLLSTDVIVDNQKFNFDSNAIIYFNQKLVICFPWKKRLCIFS
jgi:hypothetical protein